MTAAPEFSRRVPLTRIGPEPLRREIVATEAERAALAERFGLIALNRLAASVELVRQDREMIALRAEFDAEFVQSCVVTLDPVPGAVSQHFALLYGPPQSEAEAPLAVEDDIAFEPLADDAIDIGEAVAQEFLLAVPPFPRSPEAAIGTEPAPPEADERLAVLSRLLERRDG